MSPVCVRLVLLILVLLQSGCGGSSDNHPEIADGDTDTAVTDGDAESDLADGDFESEVTDTDTESDLADGDFESETLDEDSDIADGDAQSEDGDGETDEIEPEGEDEDRETTDPDGDTDIEESDDESDPIRVLIVSPDYPSYSEPLSDLYTESGYSVDQADALPEILSSYTHVFLNNPTATWLPQTRYAQLKSFVTAGKRLIVIGDHCKYGCFVDADCINGLLTALEIGIHYDGTLGLTNSLSEEVVDSNPLTAGVTTVFFRWSGGMTLTSPRAVTLIRETATPSVLVAVQKASGAGGKRYGDVIVLPDMDMFSAPDGPDQWGNDRLMLNLLTVTSQ